MEISLLCLALVLGVGLSQPVDLESDLELSEWEKFKITYSKRYDTQEEETRREAIFLDNQKFVKEHNKKYSNGEVTFHVAINKFGDLTSEEFASMMNGYKKPHKRTGTPFNSTSLGKLPLTVDWRKEGAVTAVKDQGRCGACYAFSATGALEGQTYLALSKLISLSEQNIIDCSSSVGNSGCKGGNMDASFLYIKQNDGVDTEAYYGYTGNVGSCRYDMANKGAKVSGFVNLESGNESDLAEAVATVGPISVGMDAGLSSFQLYKGGIYKDSQCSSVDLDHAVLVVGYSWTFLFGKYWTVKNSWGSDWGENGYFRLAKDHNNMCGIATDASYPLTPYS